MIKMLTEWVGLDTLGEEEFNALREPAEIAVTKATLYYEGKVKKKLAATPPRTGRIYGDHQASAPGEPPAPQSGDLRRSITHSPVMWSAEGPWAEVGSSMPYAKILEFGGVIAMVSSKGTPYLIRILPRPYFSSTWLEEEEKIQAILDKAMQLQPVMADFVAEVSEEPATRTGRDRSAAARKGWATRRRRSQT